MNVGTLAGEGYEAKLLRRAKFWYNPDLALEILSRWLLHCHQDSAVEEP